MRAPFDESLELLKVDVDALGRMAQDAVATAVAALLDDDRARAQGVIDADNRTDALFVALEERAYALVAMQAPVATDLRFLMSALRIMSDYEKTGDRAIALAKAVLEDWEREPATLELLGRMADLALALFTSARAAWLEQNIAIASMLPRRDDVLDSCFRDLVAHLLRPDVSATPSLVLHAYSAGRNLERIADHAVMVGERVMYLLTGDPSALAAEIA